jgi:hypothetical protein
MSQFYAQGSGGDGNSRLHLTTSNDVNVGKNGPDSQTIFHSSMPHLLVTEEYTVSLGYADNGYYVCGMPAAVINYLTNDPGRVCITTVTLRNSDGSLLDYQLSGAGVSVGFTVEGRLGVQTNGNFFQAVSGSSFTSTVGLTNDTCLDTGYFFNSGNLDWQQKIGYGTGGIYEFFVTMSNQDQSERPNPPPAIFVQNMIHPGMVIYDGNSYVRNSDGSYQSFAPPNFSRSLDASYVQGFSPSGRGFDSFYVRLAMPRLYAGRGNTTDRNPTGGANIDYFKGRIDRADTIYRSVRRAPLDFSLDDSGGRGTYLNDGNIYGNGSAVPIQVTWRFLNVSYDGQDGYNVTYNPFTGKGIKLSKTEFTINGVNLSAAGIKMLANMDPYAGNKNSNYEWIGGNIYRSNNNYKVPQELAGLPLAVSVNKQSVAMFGGGQENTGTTGIAFYKFRPDNQWYVDSRVPAIGNENGEIWSPGTNPLKVFMNNKASWAVGGNDYSTTGDYIDLGSVFLDLNTARQGSMLVTIDFQSIGSVFSAGGLGSFNANRSFQPNSPIDNSILKVNGNWARSQWNHSLVTIPPNTWAPIFVVRNVAINQIGTTDTLGFVYYRDGSNNPIIRTPILTAFTLALRNNGDGNASLIVILSRNDASNRIGNMRFRLPDMKIVVQKLA